MSERVNALVTSRLPAAVIFDCDGTLVDSERLAQRSWTRLLLGYGYELTDDDVAAMFGSPYPVIHTYLAARVDVPAREVLWDGFAELMFTSVAAELEVYLDAATTARALADAGVPMAVASSSPRDRLDHTLAVSGLRDLFAVVVAGDEIEHGKPAPDIFLSAAERLDVEPTECVIVEDSPTGVRAALASGARVIAVARHAAHHRRLQDAHVVLDALDIDAIRRVAGSRIDASLARGERS